jgi:hypothetical protein
MSEQQFSLSPQDLTNAVLIFSSALSLVFQDKQGIIISANDDRIQLPEPAEKILVYKLDESIHIQKYDGELEIGSVVSLNPTEEEQG